MIETSIVSLVGICLSSIALGISIAMIYFMNGRKNK